MKATTWVPVHRLAALLFGGAMSLAMGLGCAPEASTDSLCDEACTHWAGCDDGGTGYTWSYDDCMQTCMDDGDWDSGYVDCVVGHDMCWDIEDC